MAKDPYSEKYREALGAAADWHSSQRKKGAGPGVPYISHLMTVSALVWDDDGDETEAIAGLLHDAVEDGCATLDEVRECFGDDVARIVDHCSDAAPVDGEEKAPWFERKVHHLATLHGVASEADAAATMRVVGADKLANVRSILVDHRGGAPDLWRRFKGGLGGSVWYYSQMAALVGRVLPDSMLTRELALAVGALEEVMVVMAADFDGADTRIASELGDIATTGGVDATRYLAFELARVTVAELVRTTATDGADAADAADEARRVAVAAVLERWFGVP